MGQSEYYRPTPNEDLIAAYTNRAYSIGARAEKFFSCDREKYESKSVYVDDGRFTVLLEYAHPPGQSSFSIGCLVVHAPGAYGVIYPTPIIRPDSFDCAFEISYQAPEAQPEEPYMIDYIWRQAKASSFLSVPSDGLHVLPLDPLIPGWSTSQLHTRYQRGRNGIEATQSLWGQEYPVAVTPLGVSVVAHIVNGVETTLEKLGNV